MMGRRGGFARISQRGGGGVGMGWGWGNTNPTSGYAGDSSSTRLHELDGVGMGWGGVIPAHCLATLLDLHWHLPTQRLATLLDLHWQTLPPQALKYPKL